MKYPIWFEQYLEWRTHANVLHSRSVGDKWRVNSDDDKRFLALALCGEAGELANMIKKQWRGDTVPLIDIWKELADIRIYLELLSVAFDCGMDAVCVDKLKEFEARLARRGTE